MFKYLEIRNDKTGKVKKRVNVSTLSNEAIEATGYIMFVGLKIGQQGVHLNVSETKLEEIKNQ